MFKNRAKRDLLMTINVQLMIINVQKNTSAKRDENINHIRKNHFFSYIKLAAIISCQKRA